MLAEPSWWQPYYPGNATQQHLWRHYSYSDRIRYYWPKKAAAAAVDRLVATLAGRKIPRPLVHQFLPNLDDAASDPHAIAMPRGLIFAAIDRVLADYSTACRLA